MHEQLAEDPWSTPPLMEELKAMAKHKVCGISFYHSVMVNTALV